MILQLYYQNNLEKGVILMRKPMMIANWKMNKTRDEALEFIYSVNEQLPAYDLVDTVICAPAIILRDLVKRQGDNLRIGAQNCHNEESGAFTGEISPVMLETTGVKYVVLGHSERRIIFGESNEFINKKMHAALAHNLKPIFCVGETLEEREAGITNKVLKEQVEAGLANLTETEMADVVIAYEPVWAIGTGKTAAASDANDACAYVRSVVKDLYNAKVADEVRVLYGGSVKPANVSELLSQSDIDGGLVGGASLDPESFLKLVKACVK